jgi:hypothetical protein
VGCSFLPSQIAQHQEKQEITQIEIEVLGSGAGEVELDVSMAESAPSLADTDCLNVPHPNSPNRPKEPRFKRRGFTTRNRSRSVVKATLTEVQAKLRLLICSV